MASELAEYMKGRKAGSFCPHQFYSREGDFLICYFEDEDYFTERVDDALAIHRSMDDGHAVSTIV